MDTIGSSVAALTAGAARGDAARPPGGFPQAADHHSSVHRDLFVVAALSLATYALASVLELNETILRWSRSFEDYQIDELPLTFLVLALCFAWFSWRRRKETGMELEKRLAIEGDLERSEQQYRLLSRRYVLIQEAERRNLARELHDELGQYLNAIKIDAVTIRERACDVLPDIHASAAAIVDLSDHVYGVVRDMVGRLRPVALDELGLVAAMQHCVDGWRRRLPQIEFDFVASELPRDLHESASITLYRALQECLTNVAKHAAANHVHIRLSASDDRQAIVLAVSDDGRGMDPAQRSEGLGLVGMRERLEALGGRLALDGAAGAGVRVRASIPAAARGESRACE